MTAVLAIAVSTLPLLALARPLYRAADRVMPPVSQLRRRQLDRLEDAS